LHYSPTHALHYEDLSTCYRPAMMCSSVMPNLDSLRQNKWFPHKSQTEWHEGQILLI